MDDSMDGAIDVVCNLFTPQEVRQGQTGVDEYFLDQVRFPPELRSGVPLETYLEKMDRAGIQRSLLIAVRAGDLRIKGSFEIPYERVAEICQHYPARLAGVVPPGGCKACAILNTQSKSMDLLALISIPTGLACRPTMPAIIPFMPSAASWRFRL